MDVKQAIAKARDHLRAVFSDEPISDPRLEEVEFDKRDDAWLITFGLLRPGDENAAHWVAFTGVSPLTRTYKVVRIPNDATELPSIKIRELAEG
ncbi:hypothetical protein [Methylobacterium brachiatum]|uniref:hypothetical protein n=1 Tax=Methylobacterium brachiatum TaxID=269660 RepID=UPI0008E5DC8D|nr:hypothetical protein [Methylobacterium brachiatum]SFI95391.1 hypothetical protein SAMN02799642_03167 [Methylobacterium brachiatum]